MRLFSLTFVVALLGGAMGFWRANYEWSQLDDIVGDVISPDELSKAADSLDASKNKFQPNAGTVSADALPEVEIIGGTELDFGTMLMGTERTHAFRIKNSGKAPLQLGVIGSTCKCTVAGLEKTELQPGEETSISLTWKAEGILDTFAQTATIGTTDPRQREVLFTIRGRIGRTYVLEPSELNFGEFSTRDTFEKEFKLYSYEDSPLTLEAYWADAFQPMVAVEHSVERLASKQIAEHADARHMAKLKVKVSPGLPAGPLNGQVHIEVGEEKIPLSVRCSGSCVSDLRILAGSNFNGKLNSLRLGSISAKEGAEAKFHIAVRNAPNNALTLRLKEISPSTASEHLQVEVGEPLGKGSQTLFPITVKIPKNTPAFNYAGTGIDNTLRLTFETNLDLSNEISLQIRVSTVE